MSILLQQALFHRPDRESPTLLARSPGFDDAWLAEAERLILGFGDRRGGLRCPLTVFAMPLTAGQLAVVRVQDEKPGYLSTALRFHFLVVDRKTYEELIRDPFMLAAKVAPTWQASGALEAVTIHAEAFSPRTLAQVQAVLKRIKAGALKEGEDPEAPDFERTAENSESPALLGGAQVLVDGGRLVFERHEGDLPLVSGLWLLLPEATRVRLWPTSFAFSAELDFDVLVVPNLDHVPLEHYTTEDQATGYPEGTYELALQKAAEQGEQADLDAVFRRRDSRQTIRLAILLLAVMVGLVFLSRWLEPELAPRPQSNPLTMRQQKLATAAGIVAVGDPWTATGMFAAAEMTWKIQR
jgi:hypothetical protein